ncbi:SusC/RagA family TonB-linked outer membrane protein [Neolewinella aurantiaca]|uniref:SusC/RagA family TonB-linked outer membrane protein n=1 Tax=Neolewinella aurantiaca TaxID=2602767 RepID=A0A5C7F9G0_9BACT|nr:SusC/RagA family TonB-linked outer membrane protein [Neolewinella aurantiaca]TXF86693.1 SusC/RagA family TonB-linked outer membrane protein [Neolewinella aurantiaca]
MKLKVKKVIKSGLLLFGLLLAAQSVFAQRTITGTLSDGETGDPLIGAYILVTGTQTGAVSDYDGKYSLELPAGATSITVSYTGYAEQVVEVGTRSVIDVVLQSGSQLEEVVVIGYGTVKREDATGSVETVSAKEFNQGAITSAQELVSGKVAGVQVTTDGSPGGGASISIRGGSSLSASNSPLIIIDGVPIEGRDVSGSRNPLNLVNPNDIETFTVLKDASATAIYGSRASNGVVIITTKKGAAGSGLKLSYNGSVGVSSAANRLEVLDADEYRALITDQFGEGSPQLDLLGDANTDWQDEILQTALFHNHNVSASGSIKSLPYRASVGYTNQEGVLKTDQIQRISYGLNINPGFLENTLQINAGIKGISTSNNFADRGALGAALAFDPTRPVFADNEFGGYNYITQMGSTNPQTLAPANPLALLEQVENKSDVNRYIANFSADYRMPFLPELRANLNVAYDVSEGSGTVFTPATAAFAFDGANAGGADNSYDSENKNKLLEFYLNYAEEFEGFGLDVLGGYSWQNFSFASSFFNQQLDGSEPQSGESASEYYLLSLFGRANISIGDRLLLTGTIRRDGSSRFNEDNRYGIFPSAAAAYKVIDNANNEKGLNSLKLRVGYGVTGQQDVGGFYPSQAIYLASFDDARYQFGDRFITTLRPEGYNSGLKWEESATFNVAVDFGFFNDRLNGSVEVYSRKTSDLLNFIPVPAGTNLTNFITSNVGDLEGQGIELSLNGTPYRTKNSSLEVAVNFTIQDSEITRLTATEDPNYIGVATGGISGGVGNNIQIHSVGFQPSSFYVYEQVYDNAGVPVEGVYVDRNGDGVVDNGDLYRYESPQASSFFGMTLNYNVGKFDLSTAGRASFGNYVYNNNVSGLSYGGLVNSTGFVTNTLPEITETDFEQVRYFSDYFVQNASFFRLDHVTAGYRFDDVVGEGSSIRTYLTVQNPFVITDYEGIDPEVSGGIDNTIYPRARTILLGVGVNF